MSLSNNLTDKEHGKFRDNAAGPVIAVSNADGSAISAGGGGGTSATDQATFVEGTSSVTPVGYIADDAPSALAAGVKVAAPRLNRTTRVALAQLVDSAGNDATDTTNHAVNVHIKASDLGSGGGTASNFGSADPAAGTAAGFSDGTNMREARVVDVDTGAGTEYALEANLRISASGGSVEAKGQKTMASSIPVALASDQASIPVSATLAVDSVGLATDAHLTTTNTEIGGLTEAAPATDTASSGLNGRLQRVAQRLTSLIGQLPAALTGSGNLKIALVESTASVGVTGTFFQGTQPVSIASGQIVDGGDVAQGATTDAAVTTNTTGTLSGKLRGLVAILADVWDSTNHWFKVSQQASASGGATPYKLDLAATTNTQFVKASPGNVYGIQLFNVGSAPFWLKLYDKASAPTIGTDTVKKKYLCPANATPANGAGVVIPIDEGLTFTTGIAIAVTGLIGDADTTVTVVNQGAVGIDYK